MIWRRRVLHRPYPARPSYVNAISFICERGDMAFGRPMTGRRPRMTRAHDRQIDVSVVGPVGGLASVRRPVGASGSARKAVATGISAADPSAERGVAPGIFFSKYQHFLRWASPLPPLLILIRTHVRVACCACACACCMCMCM